MNELQHHTEDATIVSAIVALAQSRQLKVVAEGVETAEHQAFLTSLGCKTLQGYLLGKPVPPDRVPELADYVVAEIEEAIAEVSQNAEAEAEAEAEAGQDAPRKKTGSKAKPARKARA